MVIRVIGLLGFLMGIMYFCYGLTEIFQTGQIGNLPDTPYNNRYVIGTKITTFILMPLGVFLIYYGYKWFRSGPNSKAGEKLSN